MKFLVVFLILVASVAARGPSNSNGRRLAQKLLPSSPSGSSTRPPPIRYGKIKIPVNPGHRIRNVTMDTRKSRGTKLGNQQRQQITNRIKYYAEPNEIEVVRHPPIVTRLLNGICKLRNEIQNNKIMKPVYKYILGMAYGWFTDHWGGNTLNNVIAEVIADVRTYFDDRCKDPEESEQPMLMGEGNGWEYHSDSNYKMAPAHAPAHPAPMDMNVTPYPYEYIPKHPEAPADQYFHPGEEQQQQMVETLPWSQIQGQGQGHQHEQEQDWRVTNELTSGGHEHESRSQSQSQLQASRSEQLQI